MALRGLRLVPMIPVMRTPTTEAIVETDLAQMERWVAWVIRLTAHAADRATDPGSRAWLEGAKEDAEALQEALGSASSGWLEAGQVAIVCSVYDLWDANHDRTERIASEVDPAWHRDWRMRSAGARPERAPRALELPLTTVG
jgi:hypothetical protein